MPHSRPADRAQTLDTTLCHPYRFPFEVMRGWHQALRAAADSGRLAPQADRGAGVTPRYGQSQPRPVPKQSRQVEIPIRGTAKFAEDAEAAPARNSDSRFRQSKQV